MSYVPIGDKTVQNYSDMISVNTVFNSLSAAQKIQYINFGQQECANLSKQNSLESYKSSEYMATII